MDARWLGAPPMPGRGEPQEEALPAGERAQALRTAADALADGRLIKPFDVVLQADFAYYFVCAEADIERPKIRRFRDWLFSDVAQSQGPRASPPVALSWVP